MTTTERDPLTREPSPPIYEAAQDGCEKFAASCLNCPLPKCYYGDMTVAEQRVIRMGERATVQEIINARGEGLTRNMIAARFHISESTIARMLKEHEQH